MLSTRLNCCVILWLKLSEDVPPPHHVSNNDFFLFGTLHGVPALFMVYTNFGKFEQYNIQGKTFGSFVAGFSSGLIDH